MTTDAYIDYTHRFFLRWLPVYDLFALPIGFVYRAAVAEADPRPGRQILDLCTGTGEVALRLARRGAEVTGVDVTEAMLRKAQKKAQARRRRRPSAASPTFELMDGRHLAFADRSFDVTVISLALHDMPRRVRLEVLREALRVTRSRLVVLDYEFPGSASARRLLVATIALYESAYFRPYAEEGIDPLLAELGREPAKRVSFAALGFGIRVVECGDGRGRP